MQDGLNWFAYCINEKCEANKQLVVTNRGFGVFKLEEELKEITCPVCYDRQCELRNMGFVNSRWIVKGGFKPNMARKLSHDGETYDGSLYTLKELNYR